ncbi:hypothetical protein EHS25_005462 [Saitozyma podzolica]|uniref:Uncharacterized protein n=1 Tax=Saitozyma podzolica TaxID=1890683 RepID=A0A427XYH5_9TREE|nr:hypothetical protein EHS25_005462 [Saitozyma podzolica]
MSSPLPAPSTKHLHTLAHPLPREPNIVFNLGQRSIGGSSTATIGSADNDHPIRNGSSGSSGSGGSGNGLLSSSVSTGTTGTTLWLGAQIMACYLRDTLNITPPSAFKSTTTSQKSDGTGSSRVERKGRRVLELGSGIGYLALCMACWGYDVLATDVEPVLSGVLLPNVEDGRRVLERIKGGGRDVGIVQVGALDWVDVSRGGSLPWASDTGPGLLPPTPLQSTTTAKGSAETADLEAFSSGRESIQSTTSPGHFDDRHVDIILTTDTLYSTSLISPLWSTLAIISKSQDSPPPIYIALENRDPGLINGIKCGVGLVGME